MNSSINRSIRERLLILAVVLFGVACNTPQSSEIYAPGNKAIGGYDPVAFYAESKPVKGNESLSYEWSDATWYFASPQNLGAFKKHPEKYAPQYGGYCAYGTAEGHKAPTRPDTWTIIDDKLYLNYNNDVKKEWEKDRSALIKKADAAWPEVKKQK